MKIKILTLTGLIAAVLLAACSAVTTIETPPGAGVFPTPTKSFLFQGNAPVVSPDAPVAFSGAPTVAGVFRLPPSATPSPVVISTITPQSTATQFPQPQSFTVTLFGDQINPNWNAQQDGKKFDLKSSSQVSRGNLVISFTPHAKGISTLLFTVSENSNQVYRRDQAAKLSFWLYSPKNTLYLDQFFITLVGSNSQPYWNAKDRSVNESDYQSVFPEFGLNQLGFDHAIPADTWVMAEIDLDKAAALEPAYQYLTGISFNNAAGLNHPILIDDVHLTLLGQPDKTSTTTSTPAAYP